MLHITNGKGKMEGIHSINTPSTDNPFCQMMRKTDSICKACYAFQLEGFRKQMLPAFRRNAKALTDKAFKPEILNYLTIRFHSYGELINSTHMKNFFKIALINPSTFFGFWTKRENFIQRYLKAGGIIPSNVNMIFSNPKVNHERKTPPKGFDKVFNVFTREYAENNGIEINCGKRKCKDCMLCYTKNDVVVINEIIKKDQKKGGRK